MMARQMKNSGVDWIGTIPAHWGVSTIGKFFKSGMGQTLLSSDVQDSGKYPIFSASVGNNIFGYIDNPSFVLKTDDLVITARGAGVGFIRVIEQSCVSTQTTIYCKKSSFQMKTSFVKYFGDVYKSDMFSISVTTIPMLTVHNVNKARIVLPPLKEQVAIAQYLDDRISAIDSKIQLLEEKSTALSELRKSVIHQAVTKGLDANVAMKPSGVPSHWTVQRADKHFIEMSTRSTSEANVLTCSIEHGIMPQDKFSELTGRRVSKPLHEKDNYKCVVTGDFVYNKMRMWQGAVSISEYDGVVSPAYIVLRAKNPRSNKFYQWVLKSDYFVEQAGLKSYGICDDQNSLRYCDFKTLVIYTPPQDEQLAVAQYLDERTSIIDESIKTISDQITTLKEMRQSLIHEAVTGKIDVADFGYNTT